MKKKLLTLFLSVAACSALVLGLTACDLFGGGETGGESNDNSKGLIYELDEQTDTYTVTDVGLGGIDLDLIIPSSYEGKAVTSIGDYAFSSCELTSVTIPDSVTSIGQRAFYNCYRLTSVTIGSGVIGDLAFYNCYRLTSVTIGSGVESICDHAFADCDKLASIYYAGEIAGWCRISGLNNLMSSIRTLYINGKELTGELVIPNGVTSIGDSAFESCSSLSSVTIPDSVTSIGEYAFGNCTDLTNVTIPNSVTSIGEYAFVGCRRLTNVTIGSGVTSIGSMAFGNCTGLKSIYYMGDLAGWCNIPDRGAIMSSNPTLYINGNRVMGEIVIPEGVTRIGDQAFWGCGGLTGVTIGNSVTSIGQSAFSGCSKLKNVYYTGDIAGWCKISGLGALMSSGRTLYINGKALTGALIIPDSVTSIGSYAFEDCSSLTSVTIPDSVTSIGSSAFYNCSKLTDITFKGTRAQWNAIQKDWAWNESTGNYTVHCTDGDIPKE